MKILERFINFKDNNENPVLQNDKISQLLDKLKNNTEFKIEDLTFLESLSLNFSNNELEHHIKEEKDKNNIEGVNFANQILFDNKFMEENTKDKFNHNSQVINLGEEPVGIIDEEVNEKDENNEQKLYLTKSKVYESNMREIDKYTNESIKRSLVQPNIRNSLTNTYLKSKDQKSGEASGHKNASPLNVFSKAKTIEETVENTSSNTTNQISHIPTNNIQSHKLISNVENSHNSVSNTNTANEEKNLPSVRKDKQKEKQSDKDKNLSDLLGIISNTNRFVDEVNTKYISTSNELTKKDLRQNINSEDHGIKDNNQQIIKSNKPNLNLISNIETKKNAPQEISTKKLSNDHQEKSPINKSHALKTEDLAAAEAKLNFYKMIEFTEKKKENLFQIQEDEILEEDFESSSNMFGKSSNDNQLEVSDTVTGFKKKDDILAQNFIYSNNNFVNLNQTESFNNVNSNNATNINRDTTSEYNKTNVNVMVLGSKSLEEINRNLERMIGEYKLILFNNVEKNESSIEIRNTLK